MKIKKITYILLIAFTFFNICAALTQDSTMATVDSTVNSTSSSSGKLLDILKDWGIWGLILGAIIWAYKKIFKDLYKQWQDKFQQIQERLDQHDFYKKWEIIYRELDLPYMHWHGIENCVVFAEKEKRYLSPIKEIDEGKYKEWLAPRDYLLLAIYKEACMGDYQGALKLLNEVIEQSAIDQELLASFYLQKARILREHEENNVNDVLQLLERAIELNPHNISCLYYYAKVNNNIQEFEIAALTLEKLRELKHVDLFPINIHLTLADVYTSLKKFDNALELVESYLIFHPYHVKSIKSKANIYFHNKKISDIAVVQFRNQILSINTGDDPELYYAVALLEYRLKKFEEAEKRLDSIIIKRPRFIDYRILLANIYFELDKEEKLLETLRKIETFDTNVVSKRRIKNVIAKIERLGLEEAKKKLTININ